MTAKTQDFLFNIFFIILFIFCIIGLIWAGVETVKRDQTYKAIQQCRMAEKNLGLYEAVNSQECNDPRFTATVKETSYGTDYLNIQRK